jgi:hypothetical protein
VSLRALAELVGRSAESAEDTTDSIHEQVPRELPFQGNAEGQNQDGASGHRSKCGPPVATITKPKIVTPAAKVFLPIFPNFPNFLRARAPLASDGGM